MLFSSCSNKYKGLHANYERFYNDIQICLKKSCTNRTNNVFYNLPILSSALAYGGGGGGGGSVIKDRISFKTFNQCLKKKGYTKDENGMFNMPNLSCKYRLNKK